MVDPENKNSHVDAVMFFAASRRPEHIAAPTLLVQILKEKAFDKLRTEHGLGYNAGMKLELRPQQSAIKIYVECSQYSCLEAARITLDFVKEAPGIVEQLSPQELESYREGCIKSADKKNRNARPISMVGVGINLLTNV